MKIPVIVNRYQVAGEKMYGTLTQCVGNVVPGVNVGADLFQCGVVGGANVGGETQL